MANARFTRKLAAIFYADVAGYSRLTGADEEGTHQTLKIYLDVLGEGIESHGGRIVHYAGDAVLADFSSVIDALSAAATIQKELKTRNQLLQENKKLQFRIGINLGDVIVDEAEIYGDGVNVAARLEELADPGGIAISRPVYDQVRNKVSLGFEFQGEQQVKNIAEPVQTYRVLLEPGDTGKSAAAAPAKKSRKLYVVAILGAATAIGLGALWLVSRPVAPPKSLLEKAAMEQAPEQEEELSTPLTDKPSIVVLPFINMSGDVNQEYFSDGMTEDLLTDLSKISALRVMSRTSSFAYKGMAPDIRTVVSELGVSHIIEGSVRKAGGRVRISAQLIDAASGTHLWAERYDRELKDIFVLQDEVRSKIVSALSIKLVAGEEQRVALKGTQSVEAYDLLMKGRYEEAAFTEEGTNNAIRYYEQAIAIDPAYANAYARMANMYDLRPRFGENPDLEGDISKALEFAQKAIALDQSNPFFHWSLGRIYSRNRSGGIKNQFDAVSSLERAIELDPNYADAYAFIGQLYVGIGKPDEALAAIDKAMTLNPEYPFWYVRNRGLIKYMQGDYDGAVSDLEKATERNPATFVSRWWLAAAYAQAGRQDDAEWEIEEVNGMGFQSTVNEVVATSLIYHPPYLERFTAGLRKAGFPD